MLNAQQLDDFHRDGFLVLENFASPADCDALIARAAALLAGFEPAGQKSIFSTTEQEQASDGYFLDSGGKIRFFFEPEAFGADGALRQDKHHSINKIGHALHDLDPVFDAFSRQAGLAGIAKDAGLAEPLLLQSMLIFKPPRIGLGAAARMSGGVALPNLPGGGGGDFGRLRRGAGKKPGQGYAERPLGNGWRAGVDGMGIFSPPRAMLSHRPDRCPDRARRCSGVARQPPCLGHGDYRRARRRACDQRQAHRLYLRRFGFSDRRP
jgi:hypothetical protein